MVTDQNSLVSTYLDLTALKYKERDELEMVFKFWKSNRPLDLNRLWEQRLMAYYQSRYDVRENLIDWDYHMKLSTKLPNLPKPAFFRWRLSGNAFDTKDTLGSYPNRTLVTTMQGRGGGYWSDILHSPLVGFHSSSLSKKNTQVHGQPSFLHMKEGVPKVTLLTTQDSKQWKKYSQVDITCIGISMVFSYLHLCTSNRVLIESMEYALEDKETQEKYLEKVKSDMETLGYRMDDMHKVAGYIVFVKKNNSEVSLSPAM
ncbi:Dynein assembly factor 3, axonemal [Coelomomyces lativittatus]|nr:Dynein assembly factor 3, axonemal [Coelomomyces lativittatus]